MNSAITRCAIRTRHAKRFQAAPNTKTPGYRSIQVHVGRCGAIQSSPGIGLEPTLAEHIDNIVAVGREVRRVLRDDGTFWLNYGDAYAGSGGAHKEDHANPGISKSTSRDGVPNQRDWANRDGGVASWRNRDATVRGLPSVGFKAKDLMMMPHRIAIALQSDGSDVAAVNAIQRASGAIWDAYEDETPPDKVLNVLERLHAEYAEAKRDSWYVRSPIVWHKPNPMPESVGDRPTSAYEMIFLLTKKPRYYYDGDAIRQSYAKWPPSRPGQQYANPERQDLKIMAQNWEPKDQGGANARNVWTIPTQGRPDAHFATFPDELPRRCILAGTSEKGVCAVCAAPWERETEASGGSIGTAWHDHSDDATSGQKASSGRVGKELNDGTYKRTTLGWRPTCDHDATTVPATILDPFVGSGTTLAVAQSLGRHSIGVDLNPEYLEIAKKRIGKVSLPMF